MLCLLILLAASMAATFYFVFLRPGTLQPTVSPELSAPGDAAPIIYEEPHPPSHHILSPGPIKLRPFDKKEAQIAIIIDDMGYKEKIGHHLLDLDMELTFAFLPFGPHTDAQLKIAATKNRNILLHLPMEAQDPKWNPGPGALLTAMSAKDIAVTLKKDLAAVPGAVGVNNHMGSLFTENTAAMQSCLLHIKNNNLFFIDSLTSAKSQGYQIAREMGIKTARRDVFLDNNLDPGAIKKQLDALIHIAQKKGSAIGIGHPHQATLQALRDYQRELQKNATLVKVSELVD